MYTIDTEKYLFGEEIQNLEIIGQRIIILQKSNQDNFVVVVLGNAGDTLHIINTCISSLFYTDS